MRIKSYQPALCKSAVQGLPEKLRVVRSASVWPSGVRLQASAFVADASGCWRPGEPPPQHPPSAVDALRRHAEVHELYEREQARKVRRAA